MSGKPPKHPPKFSQQIDNLIAEAEPRIVKAAEEAFEFERKATAVRNVGAKDSTMDSVAKSFEEKAAKAYAKAETIDRFVDKEVAKREAQLETLVTEGVQPAFSSRGKTSQVRLPMSGKGTRRNTTSGGDIVMCLLTIRNQIKLYHWQTKSFARHTATDALTTALDLNIDAFVESYMGRYGRPKVSGSIKLHNFSESAARTFVATQTAYLTKVLPKKIGKDDTDLLNLRDTILADLTKVLYLFTLQ
jgi:hypothetical protein